LTSDRVTQKTTNMKFHSIRDLWLNNHQINVYKISWLTSLYLGFGLSCATLAQSNVNLTSSEVCDLNLSALKSTSLANNPNIVTADTVTSKGMTVPSLWWTSEQFPAKLVTNWIANRSQNQIYLLVNTQYWNILDYVDRYRTIDKFGRVAQGYGYNLKICNSQKIALARYTCDSTGDSITHPKSSGVKTPTNCQIWLNPNGQNGLGLKTK
jgi:hypothetical protein